MNKVCLALVALCVSASTGRAALTLDWSFTTDLKLFDATAQAGWWVQMYQDANNSGIAGVTIGPGGVAGGTGVGDVLLAAVPYSTTTALARPGNIVVWNIGVDASTVANSHVYTVLFNNASIGAATKAVIVDAAPLTTVAEGGQNYSLSTVSGSWQTIPEPTVMSLMLLGGCVLAVRRKLRGA